MTEKKSTPHSLFVDNPTERMISIHRRLDEPLRPGQPPRLESVVIGRGLNYVRSDVAAAVPAGSFGLRAVDPLQCSEADAAALMARCTSRHALGEWAKQERRPVVQAALRERLDRRSAPAGE